MILGIPLDWFISYLENRQQYVKIGDNTSSKVYITCGVPQGSILNLWAPVYRFCANFKTAPNTGIPGLRKFLYIARTRYTGFA